MEEESACSYNTELASGSLDDDVDDLNADFLQRLDPEDICDLRRHFFREDDDVVARRRGRRATGASQGQPLTKAEFIKAVNNVMGGTGYAMSASRLFCALTSDRGEVWWEEVLDHIIQRLDRGDDAVWRPINARVVLQDTPHCRRETIVKVVSVATPTSFCYAVLSKFGRVGVYDGHFHLHDEYVVNLRADADVLGENPRTTWLTDAVHLDDAEAMIVTSSDRAVHVFDVSCLLHVPSCHVAGMRHVPTCLAYDASMLFVGDDKGGVTTLRFHQPRMSLFRKKHPDKLDKYYWQELESQGEWVTLNYDHCVHDAAVIQIAYCRDNETVVSCSHDPLTTLVVRHVGGRRAPYIFRLSRGIRCFHLDRDLKLLATGSSDCAVRLWNPVVTKQPTVSLFGHKTAVVDVHIMRLLGVLVSCAKDGVLKVWDVEDQCCLHTISLDFPAFNVLGKTVEFGARTVYPTDVDVCLMVVCCNHVATLRLAGDVEAWTPLPPPSREQRASVPSPWAADAVEVTVTSSPSSDNLTKLTASSSGSSRLDASDADLSERRVEASQSPRVDDEDDDDDDDDDDEELASPAPGLNVRRAQHERKNKSARRLIHACAPHLTLELHDLAALRFSRALPVTRRMRDAGVDGALTEERLPSWPTPRGSLLTSSAASSARSSARSPKCGPLLTPEHATRSSNNRSKNNLTETTRVSS